MTTFEPLATALEGRLVRDLVCGMEIDSAQTQWRYIYEGEIYYFCHPRCLGKFRTTPKLYLHPAL
jgi:Cu+-exporting ATPase